MGGVKTYRLGASVSTLFLERLLVDPGVVPVPREEIARVVDTERLVDVCGDEVVKARLRTRNLGSRRQSGLGLQTLDGTDVRLLVCLGQSAPDVTEWSATVSACLT